MTFPNYTRSEEDFQFTHGTLNSAPARDPYYGRGDLVQQAAAEAFNFNITKSAYDYARYWSRRNGPRMPQDVFAEAVKQDGIEGMLDWDETLTVDQYVLASEWAKERQKRLLRMQYSTRSNMDRLMALGGSFAGSMIDPVEIATIFAPALRVETYALRMGLAKRLGMSMADVGQMMRKTPNTFARLVAKNELMPHQAGFVKSLARGTGYGLAEAVAREPFIYGFNTAANKEYGWQDSLVNVGASGLLGGFFHAGINSAVRLKYGNLISQAVEGQEILPDFEVEAIMRRRFQAQYMQFEELWTARMEQLDKRRAIPRRRPEVLTLTGRNEELSEIRDKLDTLWLKHGDKEVKEEITRMRGESEDPAYQDFLTKWQRETIQVMPDKPEWKFIDYTLGREANRAQLQALYGEELGDDMPFGFNRNSVGFSKELRTDSLRDASSETKEIIRKVLGSNKKYLPDDSDFWDRSTLKWIVDMVEADRYERSSETMLKVFRNAGLNHYADWYVLSNGQLWPKRIPGTNEKYLGALYTFPVDPDALPLRKPEGADNMRLKPGVLKDPYSPDLYGRKGIHNFPDPAVEPGWRRIDTDMYLIANTDENGNVVGPWRMAPDEPYRPRTPEERLNQKLTFKHLHERSREPHRNRQAEYNSQGKKTKPVQPTSEEVIADLYSTVFGVEVRFLDIPQAKEMGIAGRVMSRHANTLFIAAADLPEMSFFSGHEMFHSIKWQDPELFMQLIHVINKYDTEGNMMNKAFNMHQASLLDADLSAQPMGKHYEEAYAHIFGELTSKTDFWDFMKSNVSQGDWQKFQRAMATFFERMIRWVMKQLDHFGVKDSQRIFAGLEARNEILSGIGDKKVRQMLKEVTDLLKGYDAGKEWPYRSLLGDAELDATISRMIEEEVGKRAKKIGIWKKATNTLRKKLDDEAIIVTAEHASEASGAQLAGNALIDMAESNPIPKDRVGEKNIKRYARAIPGQKDPGYFDMYREYALLKAQEESYQNSIGPALKKMGAKLRELGTRVSKAWEEGDTVRHARLVKSYKEHEKILRSVGRAYDYSKKRLADRMEELDGAMGIIIVDHGDYWIVHWNKSRADKISGASPVTDTRGNQLLGGNAGGEFQFGSVNPGEPARWFDPTDLSREVSFEEVMEANNWDFEADPITRFTEDLEGMSVVSSNVDANTYAAMQRGNSVHYQPMDELSFDPGFTDLMPGASKTVDTDRIPRLMEEQGDSMAWKFFSELDSGNRRFVENTKRAAALGAGKLWDRMRVAFQGPQQVDETVFNALRKQASRLQGFTFAKRLTEIVDSTFTPEFSKALKAEQENIWSLHPVLERASDAETLKAMSEQERRLYVQLNGTSGSQAKRAKRIHTLVKDGAFDVFTTQSAFTEALRKSQEFTDLTDNELRDMFFEAKQFLITFERTALDAEGERPLGFRADAALALYTHMREKGEAKVLQELTIYQANRDWVSKARRLKDRSQQIKWLLSRMDGQFRKHLPPSLTEPSLSNRMRARQVEDLNPLVQVLTKHDGVWDEFTAPDSSLAKRVFLYMETGNEDYVMSRPEIREIAEVLRNINQMQVHHLRSYGSGVVHRPDYTISLNHNSSKIRDAGLSGWAQYVAGLINWEATFDRIGVPLDPSMRTEARMYEYLAEVYDDILNNRFRDRDNPADEFLQNLADEPSHARSLVFNENGLWHYDMEFGSGSPVHSLFEQIMRRADLIELMDLFGARPGETWARIKQDLRLPKSELDVMQLNSLFNFHTGQMDNPVNRKLAEVGQMSRLYANTVFLGNSGISALNDTVHSMAALKYMGFDLGRLNKVYWDAVKRAYMRNKEGGFQMQLRAQGAGGDVILGAVSRRVNGEVPGSTKVRQMGNMMFTLNGLNLWTAIAQEAMIDVINRNMHRMIGYDDFDAMLGRYGITGPELKLLKEAARYVEDIDGEVIKVTPDMLVEKNPQLARKYRVFLDDWMRQGVLEPTASGQIFARFGLQAGTPLGETVRTVTQYMAFGMAVQQKTYRRMLYGYDQQGFVEVFRDPMRRRLVNMMGFAAWSMGVGYITMNAKEILRGREPLHLGNMTNMGMRKWLFQSGIGGAMSDLLWARDINDVTSMAAGPFFGAALELGGEFMDGDTEGFLYDLERNAPFATLPVVGEARRQLFGLILGDSLMEANRRSAIMFDQKSLINDNPETE